MVRFIVLLGAAVVLMLPAAVRVKAQAPAGGWIIGVADVQVWESADTFALNYADDSAASGEGIFSYGQAVGAMRMDAEGRVSQFIHNLCTHSAHYCHRQQQALGIQFMQ
jgi:hypothetical protein